MSKQQAAPADNIEVSGPSFADLPTALACILQHVPLQQRLSRCALVCRPWWSAATAPTPGHIDVQLKSNAKCRQLQTWLGANGQGLLSLKAVAAAGYGPLQLSLPCHQLHHLKCLELGYLKIKPLQRTSTISTRCSTWQARRARLAGSSNSSSAVLGAAPVLPTLRELRLSCIWLPGKVLLQLSQLTGLSLLHLEWVKLRSDSLKRPVEDAATIPTVLQKLKGLSELLVTADSDAVTAILQPVSAMLQLQRLTLTLEDYTSPVALAPSLAALPVSLTALDMRAFYDQARLPLIVAASAQLSRLSNLQQLSTRYMAVDPTVLGSLTWLREVRLDSINRRSSPRITAARLLLALGRLTQLHHLELVHCRIQPQQPAEGADDPRCFSALTASSNLTCLRLEESGEPLPSAVALDCMFPPGLVLPHLKTLHLERSSTSPAINPCVGPAQIAPIARSCPALQQLVLKNMTSPDLDHTCLLQLPPGVQSIEGLGWQRPMQT